MASEATLWILIPLCLMKIIAAHQSTSFSNLFDDNLEELEDVPIKFLPKPAPEWLQGSYIRNGIGQLRTPKRHMKHIFDGYAKLAKVKFASSTSTFTTKFIKSNFYNDSQAIQDVAPYHLFKGPIPPFGMYEGLKALAKGFDNMNVNVIRLIENKTEYLALNDIWQNYEIRENLDTVGKVDEKVPGLSDVWSRLSVMSTSHPVQEYGTNNQINIVSTVNPLGGGYMNLVRLKSAKNRQLIASWEVDRLPYLHSFAMTKSYAILICAPTYLNFAGLLKYWEPVDGLVTVKGGISRVFVVDLHNGDVKKVEKMGTGFMMHFVNGHETDDRFLVFDGITYESMEILADMDLDVIMDAEKRAKIRKRRPSHVTRYTVDLHTMDIKMELHNVTEGLEFVAKLEMPVINENYRHKPNCFVYGASKDDKITSDMKLVKKDLCNKNRDLAWGLEGWYPTEPWFVAAPQAQNEDDGILMSIAMDTPNKKSYMVLLDAKTMKLHSKAELPTHVPWGLHGRFFEDVVEGYCEKDGNCS